MTLPATLIDAVRDQRVVLFLGAGASRGAQHSKGAKIPQGDALRDLICDKFFSGALKDRPLTAVSAMAANEAGLVPFQKYIHDLFDPYEPADFHKLLPQFRWKAIATTNFDLIVERAFGTVSGSLQELVKSVKDGDLLDTRMSAATHPLAFYKLHGCIEYYTDSTIPLILSNEQYASYEVNRQRFYGRFKDLGYEHPVVFAGYSIADPHIQRILFDLTSSVSRPMYFNISPGMSDIEIRYWASHRVTCVDVTFEDFLRELDSTIPTLARQLPISTGGGTLSIRSHYKVAAASESAALRAFLETDVDHVHPGMAAELQDPLEFYRGYDRGWGCIQQNLDAKRSFSDSVLVDAVLVSDDAKRPAELFMLKGPAGNGKSVALKRIAWEAAANYDQLVFYASNSAAFRVTAFEEIAQITGKRVLLFVDHVAIYRTELEELLKSALARNLQISIIGAERDNEWNIYCDHLESFVRQEFPVRYLNEREIDELIRLLERHKALGLLTEKSHEERVYAFATSAERQLLVALHEVTLGLPFEDIVFDEYNRIEPAVAKSVYLSICTLHQFGAPVRAGLIARASGVTFERFGNELVDPLQNVVVIENDTHSKDIFYKSRHQHVAEIVFRRALPTEEEKFDALASLVSAINVDYSSDNETFGRLIKGRGISEIFTNIELGRLFYDRVEEASTHDPFVLHQRAVFEMHHRGGSLSLAEKAARRAFELNPHSRGIRHTQAEIARRQAIATDDPLKKEAFRRITRDKLGADISRLGSADLYTRARLSVDILKEELARQEGNSEAEVSSRFVEAVRDAETAIQRGLQSYPESSELLAVEADFRDLLRQTTAAQIALEKAFRNNPRQDWLAVRLSRRFAEAGDLVNAKGVLETCLGDNPSSKSAHFELARVLQGSGGPSDDILAHLRRSFTEGDNHYEAQFWYARELFVQDRFDDAKRMFASLHEHAPGAFRNGSKAHVESAPGEVRTYNGRVERLEEGYGFIRIPQFPDAVFASRADSRNESWARLRSGATVRCAVEFSRRGPRATSLE
jgi:tetratricopeptide (TPR) repeat protein